MKLHNPNGVSIVSVCTGELCQCQEDGWNGGEILQDLLSRDLPYTVDETGCLGACGPDAMVAIDFEDGGSYVAAGMPETLLELGLSGRMAADEDAIVPAVIPAVADATMEVKMEADFGNVLESTAAPDATAHTELAQEDAAKSAQQLQQLQPPRTRTKPLEESKRRSMPVEDARDRMRAQAAADDEPRQSPWLMAASYLANKAGEKFMNDAWYGMMWHDVVWNDTGWADAKLVYIPHIILSPCNATLRG
eukprot:CAMPEP_0198130960 /NCGR_PEP_ID=MMETSP1442-20131203/55085_1 /TAXON_ID= /ORGANISM="Craspedostauros australis, Strain CCMP3328" /LENGTH=248 /DNA_ID=CAMNT_0043791681 /DNA_START=321 /DNA_END=1065 /DNA_ORIENTATION=+